MADFGRIEPGMSAREVVDLLNQFMDRMEALTRLTVDEAGPLTISSDTNGQFLGFDGSLLDDDFYQTVQDAGTPMTQRAVTNFVSGFTVADNPGNDSTDVTAAGGGALDSGNAYIASGSPAYTAPGGLVPFDTVAFDDGGWFFSGAFHLPAGKYLLALNVAGIASAADFIAIQISDTSGTNSHAFSEVDLPGASAWVASCSGTFQSDGTHPFNANISCSHNGTFQTGKGACNFCYVRVS